MSNHPGFRRVGKDGTPCNQCVHALWRERTHRWVCVCSGVGHDSGYVVAALNTCNDASRRPPDMKAATI